MAAERCDWRIRWAPGQDAQCDKEEHVASVQVHYEPGIQVSIEVECNGDVGHTSLLPNGVTTLEWFAGDRREFRGEWPGACQVMPGCTLPDGHHGRCAP